MASDDLTIHVLTEIRDEIRVLRTGLEDVRTELRTGLEDVRTELRTELRTGLGELRHEIAEVDLRNATRMTELIATSRKTNEMLSEHLGLRDRVERCEADIAELKRTRSAT